VEKEKNGRQVKIGESRNEILFTTDQGAPSVYLFLMSLHLESVPLLICEHFRGPIRLSLITKALKEPIEVK